MGKPGVAVIDCRFDLMDPEAGRRAYREGHIPGARYADLNRDLSAPITGSSGRHPLPTPDDFAGTLARLGIDHAAQVIAYDDSAGAFAARLWWMLRWVGHPAAAVLDGGLKAWVSSGGAMQSGEEGPLPPAGGRRSTLQGDAAAVIGTAEIERRLRDPAFLLVDARAGERFAGTVEPIDAVAGHIPGAVNQPFSASVGADGRFLPAPRAARTVGQAPRRPQPFAAGGDVRLGGHGLPQPAQLGGRGLAGRKALCRLLERMDSRSASAGRARRIAGSCASGHLHAATICYLARLMNTPAKALAAPNHAWKIAESLDLYQVEAWGKGYFSINADGHVVIRPNLDPSREIDLFDVVQGLKARDLHTPVVIRFSDILAHRLRHLADAFATAISENDYKNRYAAVFPIKVNQQRLVVEEVYRYGKEFGFGLEVGSKPELLAVMSITENAPERLVVCNGFKDDSYIEAVIIATKLGRTIIPVVENYEEIHLILKHAEKYGVRPKIGVRVKLASEGAGRWRESAGEKSKFGLFISEILDLHALLKERNMLDCLQLVHCHPGSQLQDIRRVKDAINELAHVYAELKIMGAGLQYIDIGGGLGVDYDGSGTNYESSMNYTLNEYAGDVVYRIKSVCDARDVPHPMIVSESGPRHRRAPQLVGVRHLGILQAGPFRCHGRPDEDYRGSRRAAAAGARFVR